MSYHTPVLLKKIISHMNLYDFKSRNSLVIVDACFGEGGYTREFLKIDPRIKIIGIEQDRYLFNKIRDSFDLSRVKLYNTNFIEIDSIFDDLEINFVNYFVFDLGISMYHIRESGLGISFNSNQPLDMRLSKECKYSAEEIINTFSYNKLADIFFKYGEEKASRKIAKAIIEERKRKKIKNSSELASIIAKVKKKHGKIHPATKVFQALRIFINNELENLKFGLLKSIRRTIIKGRIFVVTYHSLEDRIVKNIFKQEEEKKNIIRVNKKPIIPDYKEILENHSARSAKLRICEKVGL